MLMPNTTTCYESELMAAMEELGKHIGTDQSIDIALSNPSKKTQELCYDICQWFGVSDVCGSTSKLSAGKFVNPLIALAAMSEHARRLHSTTARAMVLGPDADQVENFGAGKVLTVNNAINFLNEATKIVIAGHALDVTHDAVRNNVMVSYLGKAGLSWGDTYFYPLYYKLEEWTSEFNTAVSAKAKLFGAAAGSDYVKAWSAVFDTSGVYEPWWLSEQLDEISKLQRSSFNSFLIQY